MKMHRQSASARRGISSSTIESLERRDLLTAVIDLRLANGSKAVTLGNTPNQVVNIGVYATVTGADATGTDDGFQDLFASFISTRLSAGSVQGNLLAANLAPFTATGSQPGTQADLNGDGSLDVGSTGTDPEPYFFARAGSMQKTGGVVNGASQTFEVGTLTFTVTSLASGGETDINAVLRDGRTTSVWNEDGVNKAPLNGGLISVGAPVRITAGAVTPPPPTGSISGTIYKDLNGDGKLETGETGLAGITVYIDANKNGVKDPTETSVVTATGGAYSISGLAAGTYRVREVLPTNNTLTSPTAGFYDVVVANAAIAGKNFFNQPKPAGAVSGTIYKDLNGDGKLESGETGLAGVTVFIDANKNGIKDPTEKSVVTTSAGAYSFTGLAAGTYRVREVLPTADKLIAPTAGSYDVVLAANASVTGKNFFDQPKTAVVVTVDNAQATKTGTWTSLTTPAGFLGANYLSDANTGKGTKSAAFHAALPSAGQYLVYARWPAAATQSAKVPIDIKTSTTTTTVYANQQTNNDTWVLLGTFTFDAVHGATITIRNAGTTGNVVADAVQLVKVV